MTGRWMNLGEALAQGLANGTNNFISTNNTFEQQRQQQANTLVDQQFRQQQADEQRRQFEEQGKRARDSQAFQWLGGQQQQLTNILAKGGFTKGSPEYMAAESALKDTNKLMRRVLNGETLSPDDMAQYDTVLANVAAITGVGAAEVGARTAAQEGANLKATTTQTDAVAGQTRRADELHPFTVARAGLENTGLTQQNAENAALSPFRVKAAENQARVGGVAANVAEGTQDAQIRQGNAQADAAEIGVDTARWQLGDLKTKAPLVYEGMRLSNQTAQQALDFNAEMQPGRMTALRQQNEQVRQAIDQSAALFPWQKRALTADVNVKEAQAEIVQATKTGTINRTNAESWASLAQMTRDPAAFDELVKDGVMTPEQAAPFKALAGYYRDSATAALDQARATARTAQSQTRVQEKTEGAQVTTANNQATITGNQARTTGVQANVAEGTQTAQIQAGNAEGRTAVANAGLAESNTRVAQGTEGARISAAQSGATQAAADASVAQQTVGSRVAFSGAQATSAQAAAQVDVATIPAMIATRNLAPQTAQAALNAQLTENRFADATFSARVKAVNLNNSTATQQLLGLKQQYNQNATKFPAELKYLNAQIAVQEANAKESAARAIDATGNGVTDTKSMLRALDSMRKINADNQRMASTNLQNTMRRLMPNARFSVDKYDAKSFTTMIGSAGNLTAEQRQELQDAQTAYDLYTSKSQDLSTAFAQVAGKGRIDPNVAERLGMFTPDSTGGNLAPPGLNTSSGRASLDAAFVTKWIQDNPEDKTGPNGTSGVSSDCAYIGGKFLNDVGLSIKPSNNAAELEKNARAGGWKPLPFRLSPTGLKQLQVGDLVVWTSHGKIKYGQNSGKHVAVIGGYDAEGNPLLVNNAGLKADGTQSKTALIPMFDPEGAVAYRSPQVGGKQGGGQTTPPGKTGSAPPSGKKYELAGQAIPPAGVSAINNTIKALSAIPAGKRGEVADQHIMALTAKLTGYGLKVTPQQLKQFLGSTGGNPL